MTLFPQSLLVALIALLVDGLAGYPKRLFAVIGHPVTWVGALIARLDENLNRPDLSAFAGRLRGCAALALILGAVAIPLAFLDIAVSRLAGGAASLVPSLVPSLVLGILAASLVAQRSLFQHVKDVATGLEAGLAEGRAAVAHLVGRDLDVLDASGVARAAIESLAENLSDGVVAPTLYLAFGGLPGGGL
jgi:adenosylcobinamide-phosphate synthase